MLHCTHCDICTHILYIIYCILYIVHILYILHIIIVYTIIYLPLTTQQFKGLSPEAQNEYTFGNIEGKRKDINKAIADGEDPELIKQEIDSSNLSREVKNDLSQEILNS